MARSARLARAAGARYPERMFTPSVLLASLFFACAGRQSTAGLSAVRRDAREAALLSESATLYWDAVRWGDGERAGAFIEGSADRAAFLEWLEDEGARQRLVETRILNITLGEAPPEDATDAPPREASVSVRTEGYTVPEQILRNETVEQTWVRLGNGWYLRWP